jgi:hypothetical protein
MASANGCSLPWSRLAARRSTSLSDHGSDTITFAESRLAFGQRAGLVDDQRVDLAQALDRLGVAEQHAVCARLPVATMIDIGVARPSAQGQAMISTATALIRPKVHAGAGPNRSPDEEGDQRNRSTASTNHNGHDIGQRCIGARERCAWATICTICASTVSEPTCSERITSAPVVLNVAPISLSPARLLDRQRLAGEHRLVECAAAFDDDAIDRHLLARTYAQAVAHVHVGSAARPPRAVAH